MTGNDAAWQVPPQSGGGDVAALETYLARLDAELAGASASERREILLETRSHVLERTSRPPSRTVGEVLSELGAPADYARRFLAGDVTTPAVARASADATAAPRRSEGVLLEFAQLATGRWTRLPLFALVVGTYAVAVVTFLLALGKLAEPHATGLFVRTVGGHRYVSIVWSNPNVPGRDVLGLWLVPLALLVSLAIHLSMSTLLRRLLRGDVSRR